MDKSKRGGKREGAGRPRTLEGGAIERTVSVVLSEREAAEVKAKAAAMELSQSSYIRMRLGFEPTKKKTTDV